MRLALYQPDIPQNTGTLLRMAACLGLEVDLIEPAGFDISDRNFRRSGMDYLDHVTIQRHSCWEAFNDWRKLEQFRLVLVTVRGQTAYTQFHFEPHDILMMGRESFGFSENVHMAADKSVVIPMQSKMRSLNVAVSAAMVIGEALRQNNLL